jgi:hypothetical protein
VPQGSVLGPILFTIYINDIDCDIFSKISKFADDTKIGRCVLTERDREELQRDLNTIVNWSKTWQMQFNSDKCKILHFGRRNKKYDYQMDNNTINAAAEEKDLGVIIDTDLKFSKQIAVCVKNANRVLGFINRHFEYKSRSIILPLYKALVRPHLEYNVQLWSPFLKKDIDKMERIQRRATKMIPELRNKSYEERLKDLDIHSLETRRLSGRLIETYKILNNFVNIDPNSLFIPDPNIRTRSNGCKLRKMRLQTNVSRNFFNHGIVDEWNRLPEAVVKSKSIDAFKAWLDKYLKVNLLREAER